MTFEDYWTMRSMALVLALGMSAVGCGGGSKDDASHAAASGNRWPDLPAAKANALEGNYIIDGFLKNQESCDESGLSEASVPPMFVIQRRDPAPQHPALELMTCWDDESCAGTFDGTRTSFGGDELQLDFDAFDPEKGVVIGGFAPGGESENGFCTNLSLDVYRLTSDGDTVTIEWRIYERPPVPESKDDDDLCPGDLAKGFKDEPRSTCEKLRLLTAHRESTSGH